MLELKNEHRIELANFGATADGVVINKILRRAVAEIKDVTTITTLDYGAQVEGRKIAAAYLEDILAAISKKVPITPSKVEEKTESTEKVLLSQYE